MTRTAEDTITIIPVSQLKPHPKNPRVSLRDDIVDAMAKGFFGLEEYRVNSLRDFMQNVGQEVHYTIHDHDCSGGPSGPENDIKHWVTLSLEALCCDIDQHRKSPTWRNGRRVLEMTYYWHRSRFNALEDEFDNLLYFARRNQI